MTDTLRGDLIKVLRRHVVGARAARPTLIVKSLRLKNAVLYAENGHGTRLEHDHVHKVTGGGDFWACDGDGHAGKPCCYLPESQVEAFADYLLEADALHGDMVKA